MKSDLDALMTERDYAALLVTGSSAHNPPMYYLVNGAKVGDATLVVKKRGEAPVIFANSMEREEAARSGLRVVDLGTAITFDAVSARAEYLGGVICPGIGISVSGLFQKTARLPMVDFRDPGQLIGKNTVQSMQSGLYYGMIAMIDGIVEKMVAEMGPDTKTLATGGQAGLITRGSKWVKIADEDLTLEGLRLIWESISVA